MTTRIEITNEEKTWWNQMTMEKHYSCCPIVADKVMKLWQRVEVGGKYELIPFERRVLWIRESDAKIVLRYNGKDVDECSTLCDYYGFLKSVEEAITNDAVRYAKGFEIDKGDKLSVDVDLSVHDVPVLPDESDEAKKDAKRYEGKQYRRSFLCIPSGWFISDIPDKDQLWIRLESVKHMEEKAFYSSSKHGVCKTLPPKLATVIAKIRKEVERAQGT